MKFCVDCSDPIHSPELGEDEGERCVSCIDDGCQFAVDPIDFIKQEAYVAGWEAARSYKGDQLPDSD